MKYKNIKVKDTITKSNSDARRKQRFKDIQYVLQNIFLGWKKLDEIRSLSQKLLKLKQQFEHINGEKERYRKIYKILASSESDKERMLFRSKCSKLRVRGKIRVKDDTLRNERIALNFKLNKANVFIQENKIIKLPTFTSLSLVNIMIYE